MRNHYSVSESDRDWASLENDTDDLMIYTLDQRPHRYTLAYLYNLVQSVL